MTVKEKYPFLLVYKEQLSHFCKGYFEEKKLICLQYQSLLRLTFRVNSAVANKLIYFHHESLQQRKSILRLFLKLIKKIYLFLFNGNKIKIAWKSEKIKKGNPEG